MFDAETGKQATNKQLEKEKNDFVRLGKCGAKGTLRSRPLTVVINLALYLAFFIGVVT